MRRRFPFEFLRNWIHPRLFVINSDDTGIELFNEEQLC